LSILSIPKWLNRSVVNAVDAELFPPQLPSSNPPNLKNVRHVGRSCFSSGNESPDDIARRNSVRSFFAVKSSSAVDVAVIGAGVFGVWTALELRRAKLRVLLIDAYGPGNSRSSSGGESRIIRMSYGDAAVYTRFAQQSLRKWIELSNQNPDPLFDPTGVLFTALPSTPYFERSHATLKSEGISFEYFDNPTLRARYPQIEFPDNSVGLLEPASGAIMARRAVRAVAATATKLGVAYRQEAILVPSAKNTLDAVVTRSGDRIEAGQFVFACGSWLPRLFPRLLKRLIHPTRQETFFFGAPPGGDQFRPQAMPIWTDFGLGIYAFPDLEARGVKFGIHRRGPAFDPELGSRKLTAKSVRDTRKLAIHLFPALTGAPLLEARVCPDENTNSGDFVIDRHPDLANVWIVGGGSGHGFKHGPAVGEYVSGIVCGTAKLELRFLFAAQPAAWERSLY
jgi:monomeric sarcosine oxidase